MKGGFVCLIGPANAGKSTLINALVGSKISIVTQKAHTTRGRILGICDKPDLQIVFVDTPGFCKSGNALNRSMNRVLGESSSGVEQLLLVIDALDLKRRVSKFQYFLSEFKKYTNSEPSGVILNKVDLFNKNELLPMMVEIARYLGEAPIYPISALKKDGISELIESLKGFLPEINEPFFPIDSLTDQPDKIFAAEIIREKIFKEVNQEIPYSVAVRVENWEEDSTLTRIAAVICVERDTQKGIIIGHKGEKLKSIGTAARIELEATFQTKVFLELFVRVEADWTQTAKGLQKVGLS